MNLKIIKDLLNKYTNNKRKKTVKNKLILNKMEQTTFIKKRKTIKFNLINLKNISLKNKSNYKLFLILLIIIVPIYILLANSLKIKYIEIIKQDNVTNMDIAYKALDKYRWKPIFNIEKKDVLNSLTNYQQNIENINLKISLPNTIKINIKSYNILFNTKINNKSYLLTSNWVLIPHIELEQYKSINIIKTFDKNIFLDYKKSFNEKLLKNINFIIEKLEENIIDLKISEINYYVIERELHIKTTSNTILIFDINDKIKEQIEKITIFNKEQININKSDIIYIDLRIKNKIFYCTTENEYQCYKNLKSVYSKE